MPHPTLFQQIPKFASVAGGVALGDRHPHARFCPADRVGDHQSHRRNPREKTRRFRVFCGVGVPQFVVRNPQRGALKWPSHAT